MPSKLLLVTGFVLLLAPILSGGVSEADTSLTAIGTASTGYSTNIQGVPEDDPAFEVEGDGFTDLSPGLAAAYETRRTIHNLNYVFGARLFLNNSTANSYTNTLNYQNLLTLSPLSTLRMGAGFNSGRINSFDQAGDVNVGEGEVLPDGDVEFIAYNTNAAYRRLLSQRWTGELSLNIAEFRPSGTEEIEVAQTRTIDQSVRLDRTFRRHLIGVDGRVTYTRQSGVESEKTITTGPGLFWTWNITDDISSNASVGADYVGQYPDFNRAQLVPRAALALTYSHERGRATVGADRGAVTNLLGGQTTVTSSVFANVALPVPIRRPTAITLASAYAVGDILDIDTGGNAGSTKRISGDITLATELTRVWRLGVRAESSVQEFINIDDLGMETLQETRQTIGLVVLEGRFPTQIAAQVPPRNGDRVESGNADFAQPTQGGADGQGGTGQGQGSGNNRR